MTPGPENEDPYTDPRTGVLRNKLGIDDPAELARIEADLTAARVLWLTDHPIPGAYDLAHLQRFHRSLFMHIYDWAGDLRTVVIARTEPFCLPQHIAGFAAKTFSSLRDEAYLRGLSRSEFVDRLAYHVGEVNALHPFREGNGRAQRASSPNLAGRLVGVSVGATSMAGTTILPVGPASAWTSGASRSCRWRAGQA